MTLDGSEVSTARELVEDDSPDWKIAKLAEQLEVKKHNWKMTNPDKQFPGEVIVQSDQNVDFKIIKKVMYSVRPGRLPQRPLRGEPEGRRGDRLAGHASTR